MTPNRLIAEIQKYIEIAREQGCEIGDTEDAVMVDMRTIHKRWAAHLADFAPTENAELKYLGARDEGPTIVID